MTEPDPRTDGVEDDGHTELSPPTLAEISDGEQYDRTHRREILTEQDEDDG